VNSNTAEAAMPFNLPLVPTLSMQDYNPSRSTISNYSGGLQNYLIGTDGNITFPIIGKLHVDGMTKNALADLIKTKIYPRYIKEEPIISIRYANFSISVLGEVARPNTFLVNNEKISILEALATAGDLTIYGRRDNVLLVRQTPEGRQSIRIDLRDKNLIYSPYGKKATPRGWFSFCPALGDWM
jgi:polysaccharide export outer membrane protein